MTVIAASRSADDEEVQGILIDLAATAHRHGMYPSGHPQLRIVAQRLADRLRAWLARHGSLALGVGHDTLFLRGSPDACCPPIVRDFARRLRDHQIGAVSFFEDIAWPELERLFAALSADPAHCPAIDGVPFGPNLEVRPAGYDRVSLGEADPEAAAGPDPETLWAELARAALEDDSDATAASLARAIERAGDDPGFRDRITGCLARILESLASRGPAGREHPVGTRVADLLRQVRPETLRRMLWLEGDGAARAALLRAAAASLSGETLVRLLMAGANASERGVSQTVLRLLGKIAAQAAMTGAAAARLADAELQLGVERLLVDWQLTDPNPDRYHATLDDAAWGEVAAEPSTPLVPVAADERLLRICIDLETWAAAAELAVDRLLDADEAPLLLKLLHEVGDAPYGRALAARVLTPRTLRILTAGEGVDAALLGRTARAMGPPAIVPLLDVLAESQSRAVRRTVFDTICEFGDVAADHALSRIEDERWYVRRNILSIMGQVGHVPASLPLRRLAEDGDHRVRAQAFAIASAHPDGEAALATGLADEEPRVVLAALHHLPATLSARFVGPLLRVAEHGGDPTRRSLAVRALGRIRDVAACAALIRVASPGRSWIGRVRIHRDPTAIEAVRVLAGAWADDRDARPVIRAAGRIRDPALRVSLEANG